MAKEKTIYLCSACGYETPRWMGKCPGCGSWNTLEEQAPQAPAQAVKAKELKQRPGTGAKAMRLDEIPEENAARASTGIGELDRVLGGGIVEGSLMLVGGDPGIGKSTLLLQASEYLAKAGARVLYISARRARARSRCAPGGWACKARICSSSARTPWTRRRSAGRRFSRIT